MPSRACLVAALTILLACKPSKPRSGPGVELERTTKELWAACHGGSAASCLDLDRMLDDARAEGSAGITAVSLRSQYHSDRLVRAACDAGHGPSCYDVALKTPSRGRRMYLERGCTGGDPRACKDLCQRAKEEGATTPPECNPK
jgi:hypothetical protein